MKTAKGARVAVPIAFGVLAGGLTLWLVRPNDSREFNAPKTNALCVLQLPEGAPSTSATFTTRRPVEMFHVATRTEASGEALSISISGDQGFVASVNGVKAKSFGLGRKVDPGTYTVTLQQEAKGKGAGG